MNNIADEFTSAGAEMESQICDLVEANEKLQREVEKWKREAKYYEDVANELSRQMHGVE